VVTTPASATMAITLVPALKIPNISAPPHP
jgi:hypothetical protein